MPNRLPEVRTDPTVPTEGLDVALGVVAVALGTAGALRRAVRPPDLPERLRPIHLLVANLRPLGRRGRALRRQLTTEMAQRYDVLLPVIVERALRTLPLTDLVRRYVDVNELVADVDLDAIAGRLDVQAVVGRVDFDEVARQVDLDVVLDRLDLTTTVLTRVDMKQVVEAVLSRVDLASIVSQVLDEIDLPELIRESTGTMASDTVHNMRMRGMSADEFVTRSTARFLRRRPNASPGEGVPR